MLVVMCACSPSGTGTEFEPNESTVQPAPVVPVQTNPHCENIPASGEIWIRGAQIHAAAYFVARVFNMPIVVFGGTSKPLFVHLPQKDTESAMNTLAAAAGMRAIQLHQTWVLLPDQFSQELTDVEATQTPDMEVEWELYLVDLRTLLDTLRVSLVDDRVSTTVTGRFSAFGRLGKTQMLQLLTRVSGGSLKRRGQSWKAAGVWRLPANTIPYQPLEDGCHELPMRDVRLSRTRVSEIRLQATTVGAAPSALLVSTTSTCGVPAAMVRKNTFVGAPLTENCGYEQCNYQVHDIRRDKAFLTLDSGRCDVPLQMQELALLSCDD
ncbi:MAG: hypothetical protein JXX29_08830 [Deltaproteobacteria bacterium]|nr:hypothetical protein [Deltaproteobacteria bacterium]